MHCRTGQREDDLIASTRLPTGLAECRGRSAVVYGAEACRQPFLCNMGSEPSSSSRCWSPPASPHSAVAPRPAAADVDYVFNVNCPLSHFGSDDPIVAPALPGSSHRHAFYGNSTTDAFTTTASLVASRSTCERGFSRTDRSAYWVPSLYRKVPGGEFEEVRLSADNQHLSAYYRRSGGSDGAKVKPIPQGLRMIAGNPTTTKPQSTLDVAWRCNGDPGGVHFADIPNCPAGTVLQAFVSFPDCWDGINLDSADHRSHMANAKGDRGSCPKTHPVKLPQADLRAELPASARGRGLVRTVQRRSLQHAR